MIELLKKMDQTLDKYTSLLVLLLTLLVLRIPNFFEPYWYGDEAIYLTVGQSIKQGLTLYQQIVDHKTPLIYFFATVPNQFWFRVLNTGWMFVATIFFYFLLKKITDSKLATTVGTGLFVLLSSLPWFEGNIPNGELFVLGFVITGAWTLTQTNYFNQLLLKKRPVSKPSKIRQQKLALFASGSLFGLAVLTKVPAIFDLVAFLGIGWYYLTNQYFLSNHSPKKFKQTIIKVFSQMTLFLTGAIIPIILSILYFVAQGAGQEYLQYGLLYNFHYTGSWQPEFNNILLAFLFTLKGKILLIASYGGLLSVVGKKLSRKFKFISTWLILTLVSTTLSNRPYPHYFLQLIPSLSLLTAYVIGQIQKFQARKNKQRIKPLEFLISPMLVTLFLLTLIGLNVRLYSNQAYYQNFFKLLTGKQSQQEYFAKFNPLVKENYQVAPIIKAKTQQDNRLYIWGTNPMLYALTQTVPADKFTVSFHVKDLTAYEQTLKNIKAIKPAVIVVMKDETTPLPGLKNLLSNKYLPNHNLEHMILYLKK